MKKEKKPKYTLVWEFRWKNIFIEWTLANAKEFSEYMQLWFMAIQFIDDMNPSTVAKNILDTNKD